MIWWYIVVFIVALVASYAMMPKPENAKPAGLGDITAPTAEVGRAIPVLFGERDLKGPNVCWYGDFRTEAIKAKGGKK
ncbi:hypothetical protein P9A53_gp36 [Xanthomonas phage vB_Xar_IVIA-DoCa6]|uniref:Virion structural protein n=2 Tax=Bosavirus TaxID=2946834 RepID=A0A9X9JPT0_9CAUD|nr:structural protein [Stenotrophomonas phage vB_SmaS-AXL_1]YP_010739086.1 hypothetical protein P9A53_gp36 [Xanthomonas phage vB_Xar_IVIA-DoCa6]YP_010739168.1 hypothetical protein P9A54_gp36 [Xanthomonas phage vB_Xar_IVIA-DoCa10]ATS92255.1 putative virion structural protein [Stenotrophomonas phage DLP4]UIS24792.1 structural protein [Stenotrophomonas phage vB_SmaS-AXL_1]UYA98780.1 hypothetical protein IVIADoCa6_36 [Xanthomonas phage vB_Xar_IVIA-DoCa6]UYA99021.1 hypothetical protein IVIADoCa10_